MEFWIRKRLVYGSDLRKHTGSRICPPLTDRIPDQTPKNRPVPGSDLSTTDRIPDLTSNNRPDPGSDLRQQTGSQIRPPTTDRIPDPTSDNRTDPRSDLRQQTRSRIRRSEKNLQPYMFQIWDENYSSGSDLREVQIRIRIFCPLLKNSSYTQADIIACSQLILLKSLDPPPPL